MLLTHTCAYLACASESRTWIENEGEVLLLRGKTIVFLLMLLSSCVSCIVFMPVRPSVTIVAKAAASVVSISFNSLEARMAGVAS